MAEDDDDEEEEEEDEEEDEEKEEKNGKGFGENVFEGVCLYALHRYFFSVEYAS